MNQRIALGLVLVTVAGGAFLACSGGDTLSETDAGTDTGVADTGSADTGSADTGVADTGSADTGVADTGSADTGSADTGAPETTTDAGADTAEVATDAVADTLPDSGCPAAPYGTISGTIYYSRLPATGEGEIWVAKGDGSSDVKLTNGVWPRLSADGKYMVFHRDNAEPARGNVYVRDMTSGVETKIFTNTDFVVGVAFGSGGTKVVYDSACTIVTSNRDGSGGSTLLTRDCFDDSPDPRPSDGKIVFHNVHQGLLTMPATGTTATALTGSAVGDVWPRWSPSGTKLSFVHVVSESDPQGNIGVIGDDGTGRKLLTSLTTPADGFRGGSAAWTPDGAKLVAAGSVCGANGLYAVDATSGAIVKLQTAVSATMVKIDFVGDVR